ncbi:MAG: amidohydrolase [Caulobacter sp.]|nr:amidohydrolase [Caulobacter sp.]
MKSPLIAPLALLAATWLAAAPAAAETVAIVNARLETAAAAGTIPSGAIVLKDGKIIAVGAGVTAPAGARVIDARGGVVTPGLIAASTNLSVSEVSAVRETQDDGSGRLTAGFDVSYGVNPDSTMIPLARQSGVTRGVVTPELTRGGAGHKDDSGADDFAGGGGGAAAEPGMFAGQAAIISLAAGDTDPVEKARVAVGLDLGEAGARNAGGSRGAALVLVRAAFEDARAFARNRAAYDRGATREFGLSRVDLEALIPVVEGRTPLLIRVHKASDIRQALRLAREEKVKIILEGAEEGWRVAGELAAAGVPVIVDSQADLPSAFEALGSRLDNAARLQAAGVTVAIMGARDFNNLRQARFNAGLAVANGLPREAAMATLTSNVAKIWGMTGVGSLVVGQTADVVLWTGDPLETSTWPVAVFIGGVEQPQSSRAFELRDRYATPSTTGYPPAYR